VRKWHAWQRLTPRQRRILIRALVALPPVAVGLRLMGWVRLRSAMVRLTPRRAMRAGFDAAGYARDAASVTNLLGGQRPLSATCLRRSAVLWWLLRRAGLDAQVVLGARKEEGRFEAHAWVEAGGAVLNDRPDVRQFYAVFEEGSRLPSAAASDPPQTPAR
jgi:hypothetical protein